MTYFGFLVCFLIIPIAILNVLAYRDRRAGHTLPLSLRLAPPAVLITGMAVIAVLYTTPWDNYLVATRVWWYDPALVTGITLGWVPLEEYTFFILQTVMTGLWLLFLARGTPVPESFVAKPGFRLFASALIAAIWIGSTVYLLSGNEPGRYLSLELVWALPPILLQLAFGADILWHHRRLVIPTILTATFYLCVTDELAIRNGIWTINPALTTGILVAGELPLEEALFFLLTNTLLTFGLVLGLANESYARLPMRLMRSTLRGHAQPERVPQ